MPCHARPSPCRISSYCKSKGWQRIQDARREDYQLKWCEVKSRDTYCSFREGGGTGRGWGWGCGPPCHMQPLPRLCNPR